MSAAACVVDSLAVSPDEHGVRATLGSHTGALLEQAVIECAPGHTLPRATGASDEVLFVIEAQGTLHANGESHALEAECGVYLGPAHEYTLESSGPDPLKLVSVRIPEAQSHGDVVVRRLADQESQDATSDREFRIVADPTTGLRSATHFVGYIPRNRAPEHFHTYDEVIYVLDGEGRFHTEHAQTPVRPGSCIQLPARTVHCLENTGHQVMRVVAVFRPAGSPAAAYYPDGTPAYAGTPPVEAA
jgi:mannose-6-phosphate isomerase-like protein (cupin superfamily)